MFTHESERVRGLQFQVSFQGHLLIATVIKYAFSNSCAAIDQISTHIAHCAVTMQ